MQYEVESRALAEQPTAVVRERVALDRIGEWISGALRDVYGYLGQHGASPSGPPFGRFVVSGAGVDAEAGVPVPAPLPGAGRVEPSTLPAASVAVVVHVGSYDSVGPAYLAVESWIRDHGFVPAGTAWENYLSDPSTEPERIRTEIVGPYRAA